jgi:hypothetical protein
MTRLVIALMVVVLSGCAPNYTWVRADATQADFNQDMARCEYEAASSTATYGSSTPPARTLGGSIGQGIGLGFGQAMQSNKLIVLCMRAKGYAQAPPGTTVAYTNPAALPADPDVFARPSGAPVVAAAAPSTAPVMAAGLKTESKYLILAETLAKQHACSPPFATMTAKGTGLESFQIGCPDGRTLAVNCEVDGCRILR